MPRSFIAPSTRCSTGWPRATLLPLHGRWPGEYFSGYTGPRRVSTGPERISTRWVRTTPSPTWWGPALPCTPFPPTGSPSSRSPSGEGLRSGHTAPSPSLPRRPWRSLPHRISRPPPARRSGSSAPPRGPLSSPSSQRSGRRILARRGFGRSATERGAGTRREGRTSSGRCLLRRRVGLTATGSISSRRTSTTSPGRPSPTRSAA